MEISPGIPAGTRVCHSTSFTIMLSTPLPVAAQRQRSHRMRPGNPPDRYELACRSVSTLHIDLSHQIPASRHPRDTQTIVISSERTTPSSCSLAMPHSFHSSSASPHYRVTRRPNGSNRSLPRQRPAPSVPLISAPSSLTRSHGNLALSCNISSKRGRTADKDDINKFQAVVAEEEEEMSFRISYVEAIWTRTNAYIALWGMLL